MFVSLLDHLRLTFGHIVYRHRLHVRLAYSRTRWSRWLRGAEALLMTAVLFAAAGSAFGRGPAYAIVAAVLAGVALLTLVLHLTFDLDRSAQAHASCATRLWYIREQYRALLSDLSDGVFSADAARTRRDALMLELQAIYDDAPPGDREAHQAVAKTLPGDEDRALTDQEIDAFLPDSLHKPANSPAA